MTSLMLFANQKLFDEFKHSQTNYHYILMLAYIWFNATIMSQVFSEDWTFNFLKMFLKNHFDLFFDLFVIDARNHWSGWISNTIFQCTYVFAVKRLEQLDLSPHFSIINQALRAFVTRFLAFQLAQLIARIGVTYPIIH